MDSSRMKAYSETIHLGEYFLSSSRRCSPVLDGRRGGFLRADSVENTSSGLLDVLQALRQ